jgi:hypothetical protein
MCKCDIRESTNELQVAVTLQTYDGSALARRLVALKCKKFAKYAPIIRNFCMSQLPSCIIL